MKTTIKLVFAAAAVLLVACQKEEVPAPSSFPRDRVMRIATNVELPSTRAGVTAENISQLTINIENAADANYSYHTFLVKQNGVWNGYADKYATIPLTMLWQNGTQPVTVRAASAGDWFFKKAEFTMSAGGVEADQRDEVVFRDNDALYMEPTVINPATDLTPDGKLPLTFKHLLTKVNISITLGTEFNATPGTATNPISEVKINGTKQGYNWYMSDNNRLELIGEVMPITPFAAAYTASSGATNAVANYEVILVPQTVAAKDFSVSFKVGDKPYMWTSDAAVTLEQGKLQTLAITAGEDKVNAPKMMVGQWRVTDNR